MSDSIFAEALHRYIFSALNDESPQISVTDLETQAERPVRIFDHVPQNTEYAYIELGNFSAISSDTKNSNGERIEFSIEIWSRQRGRLEVRQIARQVSARLHNLKNISMSYGRIIHMFRESYADVKTEDSYNGTISMVAIVGEQE